MLKLSTYKYKRGHESRIAIALFDGDKCLCSFPVMLNAAIPPSLAFAKKILKGETIVLNFDITAHVTVYRIENEKNGEGMYNCDPFPSLFQCPFYDFKEKISKAHPRPEDDSQLVPQLVNRGLYDPNPLMSIFMGSSFTPLAQEWRYGFSNIAQMRMWMHNDKVLRWLADNNFIVAKCNVPNDDALIGHTQVMFKRPKHYEKLSITDVFNLPA
jgi:hypothetical protein